VAKASGRIFSATSRPSLVSLARYTSPYTARVDGGLDLIRAELCASCERHFFSPAAQLRTTSIGLTLSGPSAE
jgi:hypothetical protein